MGKKLGSLIRKARTDAGLTQEALAKKIKGLSAADLSLAERGGKELTQAVLKELAKATGVTQKSLLDAAKEEEKNSSGGSGKSTKSGSGKSTKSGSGKSAKSGSGKSTKTGSGKNSSGKTGTTGSSSSDLRLSREEKKLIQAYRKADKKIQMTVNMMLLGNDCITADDSAAQTGSIFEALGQGGGFSGDMLQSLIGSLKGILG